ncbi:uncharacterized protein LOC113277345 isoform X2 [Papaver somniferum]|nr:uncharacterized protein LOC113277345 isoform X2 [Papaver somniferum]
MYNLNTHIWWYYLGWALFQMHTSQRFVKFAEVRLVLLVGFLMINGVAMPNGGTQDKCCYNYQREHWQFSCRQMNNRSCTILIHSGSGIIWDGHFLVLLVGFLIINWVAMPNGGTQEKCCCSYQREHWQFSCRQMNNRKSFKEPEVCGIWMNKEVDRYGGKKMKQGIRRTH